jgi:hypothetical protein
MKKFIGAIDQGTTSTKFILFDHESNIVAFHQLEHKQIFPKAGWVEHDPIEIHKVQIISKLIIVLIVFVFVGCLNIDDQRNYIAKIELEKEEYSITETIEIAYKIGKKKEIYLYHCNFEVSGDVQIKRDGGWEIYSAQVCLAIYPSGLMRVEKNANYSEVFKIKDVGEYRIRLRYEFDKIPTEQNFIFSEIFFVTNN